MRTPLRILATLAAMAVVVSACESHSARLVVFAAASLTDAFTEIAEGFEDAHSGTDIVLNFAGSSTLRAQILEGAPADVFASADHANMESVVAATDVTAGPFTFAANNLVIAVPAGNPGGVAALADLSDPGLLVGLCATEVPCGASAAATLSSAGVIPSLDTAEPNVRALLTKIEAAELDAGIVYRSDTVGNDAVESLLIPEAINAEIEYPIAALTDGMAARFVEWVLSPEAQRVLEHHGFRVQ